jgi:hypothetical protein
MIKLLWKMANASPSLVTLREVCFLIKDTIIDAFGGRDLSAGLLLKMISRILAVNPGFIETDDLGKCGPSNRGLGKTVKSMATAPKCERQPGTRRLYEMVGGGTDAPPV